MSEHTAKVEIYEDAAGEWRWRLKAANGEIIADSSESYVGEYGAARAADRVEEIFVELYATRKVCKGMCDTEGGPHVHVDSLL